MSTTSSLGAKSRTQQEFLDRYDRVFAWALKLSRARDVEAKDLVHEAYVAYTRGQRPDDIRNLNGYLYGILRNLLRADRRRAERKAVVPWAVAEDFPDALRDPGIDAAAQLEARETLLHIARFARDRARQSKTGSALLLRYFHGYTPREIARIMRVQTSNVDDWLKLGRREARSAAAERPGPAPRPNHEATSVVRPFPQPRESTTAGPHDVSVIELRRQIFQQPPGRCLAGWRLKRLYQSQPSTPIETAKLAHIVTCAACLERVSDRLGFPGPSARHPVDALASGPRRDARPTRRTMVAGSVILTLILASAPGRAAVEASASALMRAASRIATSVSTWLTGADVVERPMPVGGVLPVAAPPPASEPRIVVAPAVPAPIVAGTAISEGTALALQLEALALLDRRGVLLGRELTLTRDRVGRVRLATIASDAAERDLIRSALSPLARTRDFTQDIQVLGDVIKNAKPVEAQVIVRDLELTQEPTPLLAAIRKGTPEAEIAQVVNRALDGSRQSLLHASVVLDLVQRFEGDTLRIANPAAYASFETMMRYHALAFARATERVRRILESAASVTTPTEPAIADLPPAHIRELAARLRELAFFHDQTLGISLAAIPAQEAPRLPQLNELLVSLRSAERLAEQLAGF